MEFRSEFWKRIYQLGIVPVEVPNPKIAEKEKHDRPTLPHKQNTSHDTVVNYVYSDDVYNTPSLPDSPCELSNNRLQSKTEFSPEAEELRLLLQHDRDDFMRSTARVHAHMTTNLRRMYPTTTHTTASLSRTLHTLRARSPHRMSTDTSASSFPSLIDTSSEMSSRQIASLPLALGPPAPRLPEDPLPSIRARVYGQAASQASPRPHAHTTIARTPASRTSRTALATGSPSAPAAAPRAPRTAAAICAHFLTLRLPHAGLGMLDSSLLAFTRLQVLSVAHNGIQALSLLPPALLHLDIAHNALTRIELPRATRGEATPRLLTLDVSHNALTRLDGLVALPHLTHLDASHNDVASLRTLLRTLPALPALTHLSLHHNPVALLPAYPLAVLIAAPALRVLDGAPVPHRVSQWAAALRALFARMLRVQHPFALASAQEPADRACPALALPADAPEQCSPPSPSRPLSPAAPSSARRGRHRDTEHADSRASSASASTSSPASRLKDRRKDPSAGSSRDGKESVRSRGGRREKERDRKAQPPEASPAQEPSLLTVGLRQIPPVALPLAALATELALPPPPATMPLVAPAPRARKRGQSSAEAAPTSAPLSAEVFARRHNMRLLAHVVRASLSALVRALFVELRAAADPAISRSRLLADAHAAAEAAAKTAFASACATPAPALAGSATPVVVSPPADEPAHVLSFGMSVTQAAPPPCLSLFAREDVGFVSSVAWLARRATAFALAAPRGIPTPPSPKPTPPPAPEPAAPEEPAALPMLALTPALLASMDGSVLPSELRAREAREQEERDRAALVAGADAHLSDQRGDGPALTITVPPSLPLATGAGASSPPASPLSSPISPRAARSPRARRSSVVRRRSLVLRLAAGDEFASLVVDQRPVHADALGTTTAPSWFLHETDAPAFRSSCPAAAALRGVASDAPASLDASAPVPPVDCEAAEMPRSLLLRSAPPAAVPSLPVHFAHALTQVAAPEGCARVPPNRHASHLCSCDAFPGPPHPPHLCSHLRTSVYPLPAELLDSYAPLAEPLLSDTPQSVSLDPSAATAGPSSPAAADSTRCAAYALEEFHCPPSQLRVCASQHELHAHAFATARDPSVAPTPAAACCFGAHPQVSTSALTSHTDHAEETVTQAPLGSLCGPAAHLDAALAADAARCARASLSMGSATGLVSASAPAPAPTTPVRETRDKTKKPATASTPGTCVCPNADCAGLIFLAPAAQPKDKATGVPATLAAGTAFGARADVTVAAVAQHAAPSMTSVDPLQPPTSHLNVHTTTMLSQATAPAQTPAPPAAPAAALSQLLPAYEAFLAKQPLRQHSLLASSGSFTLPLAPRAELLALLRDECLLGDSVVTPAFPATERREDPYARGCVSVWWAAEVEYRAQLLVRLPLLGDALLEVRRGPIAEPGVAVQGHDAVLSHTLTQGLLSSATPAPERAAKGKANGKASAPSPVTASPTPACPPAQHTHTATLVPPCSPGSAAAAHAPLRVVSHNADLLHVHAMCAVQPDTLVEQLLHPRTNTSAHGYHSLGAARAVRQTNLAPHVCAVVNDQCVRAHAVHLLGSPWVPMKLTVIAEPRFTWRQLRHLATPSMAWLVTRCTRAAITATTFLPHAALHGQQPPSDGSEVAPGSASPQSPAAAPAPSSAPAPLALGAAAGKRRKAPGDLAVCRSERFTHSRTEWRISAPVQFDLLAPALTSVEPPPAVLADSAQEQERPSTGVLLPPVRGASSTTASGNMLGSSPGSSNAETFVASATTVGPMSSVVDACSEQVCPPNVMLWLLGMLCRGHKRYSAHVDNHTFTLSLLDKSPHVRNGSIVGHMFVNCDQPATDAGLTGSHSGKE